MKIIPAIFEQTEIRRAYDEKTETWWFSVVDIIQVLTQKNNYQSARNYWKVLKHRLAKEGSQSVTVCNQLKLPAALAELSTRQIAETADATGMTENKTAARTGGKIAKRARLELESKTGQKVVTGENFLPPSTFKKVLPTAND